MTSPWSAFNVRRQDVGGDDPVLVAQKTNLQTDPAGNVFQGEDSEGGKTRNDDYGVSLASFFGFKPSPEARETYSDLKTRWIKLFNWGLKTKVPFTRPSWEHWEDFRKSWEDGTADLTDLSALSAELQATERNANGYDNQSGQYHAKESDGKGFNVGEQIHAPAVENLSNPLKSAQATQNFKDGAEAGFNEAIHDAEEWVKDKANPFGPTGLNHLSRYLLLGGIALGVVAFGPQLLEAYILSRKVRSR